MYELGRSNNKHTAPQLCAEARLCTSPHIGGCEMD